MKQLLFVLLLTAGCCRPAVAQEALPPDLQLTLLAKVLAFDRRFAPDGDIVVAVIWQPAVPASARAHDAWRGAAEKSPALVVGHAPVRIVTVEYGPRLIDDLRALGARVAVITPLRGVNVNAVGEQLRAAGLRTATGVREYEPYVGVSMLTRHGRPHIVIRQSHTRREGYDFSAQLLRLAEVHR